MVSSLFSLTFVSSTFYNLNRKNFFAKIKHSSTGCLYWVYVLHVFQNIIKIIISNVFFIKYCPIIEIITILYQPMIQDKQSKARGQRKTEHFRRMVVHHKGASYCSL